MAFGKISGSLRRYCPGKGEHRVPVTRGDAGVADTAGGNPTPAAAVAAGPAGGPTGGEQTASAAGTCCNMREEAIFPPEGTRTRATAIGSVAYLLLSALRSPFRVFASPACLHVLLHCDP